MRRQIVLKVTALTPVVFTTWFVTSLLMGSMKSNRARADSPAVKAAPDDRPSKPLTRQKLTASGKPKVTMTRKGFFTSENRPADEAGLPAQYRSKLSVKSSDVRVDGRRVSVNAAIDIDTARRDLLYVWMLEVCPLGTEQPVRELAYTNQAFEIHPSGKMTPTFSESFQLPPGQYRVRLELQRLPAGTNLDVAKLPSVKGSVGATREIEIK
jgi:hypothetical protein